MSKEDDGKGSRSAGGFGTFGEALGPIVRGKLEEFQRTLRAKAQKAIEEQKKRTLPPWRKANARPTSGDRPRRDPSFAYGRPGKPSKTVRSETRPNEYEGIRVAPIKAPARGPEQKPHEYWRLACHHSVQHTPPASMDSAEKDSLRSLLRAGISTDLPGQSGGRELYPVIGFDFGTSATKVIVRLFGEPGDPGYAIEMPPALQSEKNPHFWATVIWARQDGSFVSWPEPGAVVSEGLKLGLMTTRADEIIGVDCADPIPTHFDATVAYLATAIRYVRGWMYQNHPGVFANRTANWLLNLGLPAANDDDPNLLRVYRKAAAAALMLANSGMDMDTTAVRLIIDEPDIKAATESADTAEVMGIAIIPEVAAEVAGFSKSTGRADGLYFMVDVGAATLDVCTFWLAQTRDGSDRYSLLLTDVQTLGVEAQKWFLDEGKNLKEFADQCAYLEKFIVWTTKKQRHADAECWQRDGRLSVFLCGGGSANALHRGVTEELDPWLKEHAHNSGINILELDKPQNLAMLIPEREFHRLAVAWGLSYQPFEIGQIVRPSQIPNIGPLPRMEVGENFITMDMV